MQTITNLTDSAATVSASGGEFVRRLAVGGASLTLMTGALYAQPAGENIVAGNVGITRNGNLTQITASNGAAINWQSFDIGAGHTVQFLQPDASARVLNRVASADPTQIAGTLLANGRVYIVNPAGVYFRAGSVVNAGAIYAAAGKITDADFARRVDRFTSMTGTVVNEGALRAAQVVLTGASVGNAGRIDSPAGTVIMAAGGDVLIGERGGSMYARVLAGTDQARGEFGTVAAGVSNTGTVNARGGTYQAVSGDIFGMAIRQGGSVQAARISVQGGNKTATTVDGTLDASGRSAGERGGKIEVTGQTVALRGATLDASGTNGGGVVNVGGGYQGRGELANAEGTVVDRASTINVDAIERGHGGNAVIWSNNYTLYQGHTSARGARAGGDGGFIEVSSKETLAFRGTAEARALGLGKAGRLLLDPKFIIVADTGADGVAGNDEFAENAAATATFDADLITTILNAGTALELQANTDITINETITVAAGGAGGMFTLRAGRSIVINQNITTDNGAFNAFANDAAADAGNRDANGATPQDNGGIFMAGGVTIDAGTAAAVFSIGTFGAANSERTLTLDTVTASSITADSTGADMPGSGAAGANTGALIVNGVLMTGTGNLTLRGGTVTTNASLNATAGMASAVSITATAGDVVLGDTLGTNGGTVALSATGNVMVNAAVTTLGGNFEATADSDGSGAGTFSNGAAGTVDTTNAGTDGNITILGRDANLGATLMFGVANISFQPNSNLDFGLGDAVTGGFDLSNPDLDFVIGTGSVTIGDGMSTFVTNLTVDNAQFDGIMANIMGNTLTLRAGRSNNGGTVSLDAAPENFSQFAGGVFVRGADAVSVSQAVIAPTIDLQAGSDGTGDLAIGGGAALQADTITLTSGAGAPGTARITFAAGGTFRNAANTGVPGNFNIISDAPVGSGGGDTTLPLGTAFSAGGDLTGVAYNVTSFGTITLTDATATNNANLSLTPGAGANNLVVFNSAGVFNLSGLTLPAGTILELGQGTTITTTAGSNAALTFGEIRTNADSTFYDLLINLTDAGSSATFNHDIGGGIGSLRALGGFSVQSPAGASVAFTGQNGLAGVTQSINVGTFTLGANGANVNSTINATTLTRIDAANMGITVFGTILSQTAGMFRDLTLNGTAGAIALNGNIGGNSQAAATQRLGVFTTTGAGNLSLPANLNVESGSIGNPVVLNQALSTVNVFGNNTVGFTFNSTVAADATASNRNLAVNTPNGAFTTFTGNVGGADAASVTKLQSLATDAGGSATFSNVFTTGAQTLQGSAVALNGAAYNSEAGTITIGETGANSAAITLAGGAVSVLSGGAGAAGDITFAGTLDGAAPGGGLLTTSSAGTTSFNGAVGGIAALGTLTTDVATGTLNIRGSITTIGAQNYNQRTINFNDTLVADNTITLSTVNNGILFNDAMANLLLSDNVVFTINGGGSAIGVQGTVNDAVAGTHTLTTNNNGATTFNGAIGGTMALNSFTANGTGTLSLGNVATANDQSLNNTGTTTLNGMYTTTANGNFSAAGPVLIAGATVINTGGGSIVFNGTVDDAVAGTNTLSTTSTLVGGLGGEGTQFIGAVGGTVALLSLTTNGAGDVGLVGNATTTGSQNYANTGGTNFLGTAYTVSGAVGGTFAVAGPALFGNDATVDTSAAGATGTVVFSGTVDDVAAGASALVINSVATGGGTAATAGVRFLMAVGGTTALESLTVNGAAASVSVGNVATGGDQAYNNTGSTFLNGTYTTTAAGANGLFSVAGPALLAGNAAVNTGSGAITFNSTVDDTVAGTNTLSTTSTAVGGLGGEGTQFIGAVGGTSALLSLTTNGAGDVGMFGNATTTGSQNYANTGGTNFLGTAYTVSGAVGGTFAVAGPAIIANNATVDTTASGAAGTVTFAGTVDDAVLGSNALIVNSVAPGGGTAATAGVRFLMAVGGTTALESLTVNGAAGSASAGNVTTVGNQTFANTGTTFLNGLYTTVVNGATPATGAFSVAGPALLVGDVTVNTDASDAAGNVTFSGTVDSEDGGNRLLIVALDTGAGASVATFAGDIGTANANMGRLGSLRVTGNAASGTAFTGAAGGGQFVRAQGMSFANAATIANGTLTTFDATGVGAAGNVTFGTTLDSNIDGGLRNATINLADAGATLLFGGDIGRSGATTGVGAVTPRRLGALAVTGAAASTTAFTSAAAGGQRIDATGMSFANNVTIANATLTAFEANGAGAAGSVTFTGTLNSAAAGTFRSARVTTGTGAALATFTGAVGGTNPLGQLVVGGNSRFDGDVSLNGEARRISTDTTLALLSAPAAATDAIQPLAAIGTLQPRISFTNTGTLAVGGGITIAGNNGALLFGNDINRVAGAGARSLALTTTAPTLNGTQYDALTDAQRRLFIQSYIPAVAFGGNVGSTVAGNRLDSFTLNAAGNRGLATVGNDQSFLSTVVFSRAFQTNNFAPLTTATLGGLSTIAETPTFQVATTGPITFGQNEKITAFGNLSLLSNAGAITLGDVNVVGAAGANAGNLVVGEAGTTAINVLTRAAGRVASVGAAAVTASADSAVDFNGNSLTFFTALTNMGTGAAPQFATPTGDGVMINGAPAAIGTVRLFPSPFYSATPPSLLTDGSTAGTANNILALDIRAEGPVPRSDRNAFVNQVDLRGLRPLLDDLAIKTAERDQLRKIDILVRDLPAGEIVDALVGRAVYNDRPGISDYFGGSLRDQSKSAPRLSYDAVAKLVSAFNVLEPDQAAVSAAVSEAFNAARGQAPATGLTADGFAAYAATQGPDTVQGSAMARVRELLDLVDLLALSPVEARIVKRAIIKRFGPADASREELDAISDGLQQRAAAATVAMR